jgi:hypothetical protein
MAESKPMNPLEMVAYVLSKQVNDHEVVYIGTGLPMVAAILAKKTHAPHITFVYESGGQDPIEGGMPWSVGGPETSRKSPMIMRWRIIRRRPAALSTLVFWALPARHVRQCEYNDDRVTIFLIPRSD